MAYPQLNPDQYAVNTYGFIPFSTPLSSPGDIYESPQSGGAFAVGPNSDIANVRMAYFDDQATPGFMQFVTLSPRRALVGTVNARNEASYAPSARPGKILFWAEDIYDPNYRPTGFVANTDHIEFIAPVIEVYEYLKMPTSLGPARIDKEFVFQNYNFNAGVFYLVVPYYGRKYCYVNFTNRNQTTPNTMGIVGVNYAITQDGSAHPYHQETTIRVAAAVNSNIGVTQIIRASANGMFDALVFSLTNAGPAPLRITMSDDPL
jgi:hypothetical protein